MRIKFIKNRNNLFRAEKVIGLKSKQVAICCGNLHTAIMKNIKIKQ